MEQDQTFQKNECDKMVQKTCHNLTIYYLYWILMYDLFLSLWLLENIIKILELLWRLFYIGWLK